MSKFVKKIEFSMLKQAEIEKEKIFAILGEILKTNDPENKILSTHTIEESSEEQENIFKLIVELEKRISLKQLMDIAEKIEANIQREIHIMKWTYEERFIIII